MTPATAHEAEHVRRVAVLRLLSLAVSPPTAETLEEQAALAGALLERGGAPADVRALAAALDDATPESVATCQARLFGGEVMVAPYEGSYEDDPFRQARQMSDVAGFYAAFGAAAHGPAHERPDHAGCELEFLAFLGARRLAAEADGAADEASLCGEIEAAFLREHAGRWLPAFFLTVARAAGDPFHRALGALGAATLEEELRVREIEPEPVGPRARRLSVEADELRCAAGDEQVTPLVPGDL